ncbi:hypothetical protein C8Q76DRAFT_178490 [Earliella scabrosa]|nr:hypothetical protein C8Q76DRAFT_178490 [Earliella scabrosa]
MDTAGAADRAVLRRRRRGRSLHRPDSVKHTRHPDCLERSCRTSAPEDPHVMHHRVVAMLTQRYEQLYSHPSGSPAACPLVLISCVCIVPDVPSLRTVLVPAGGNLRLTNARQRIEPTLACSYDVSSSTCLLAALERHVSKHPSLPHSFCEPPLEPLPRNRRPLALRTSLIHRVRRITIVVSTVLHSPYVPHKLQRLAPTAPTAPASPPLPSPGAGSSCFRVRSPREARPITLSTWLIHCSSVQRPGPVTQLATWSSSPPPVSLARFT